MPGGKIQAAHPERGRRCEPGKFRRVWGWCRRLTALLAKRCDGGARKGRSVRIGWSSGSVPATEWILVLSMASSKVRSGRMDGSRCASILFPEPGGPMSSALWNPAAAISNARLANSWPMTSAISGRWVEELGLNSNAGIGVRSRIFSRNSIT